MIAAVQAVRQAPPGERVLIPTRKMNDVPATPYRHGPRRRITHDFVALIYKVVGGGPAPAMTVGSGRYVNVNTDWYYAS